MSLIWIGISSKPVINSLKSGESMNSIFAKFGEVLNISSAEESARLNGET